MVTIAFSGVCHGVGTTHACISLATALAKNGHKVGIVERNESEDFLSLGVECGKISEEDEDIEVFTYKGIDYILYQPKFSIALLRKEGYDFVILDFGTDRNDAFYNADYPVSVVSGREWKRGHEEFYDMLEEVSSALSENGVILCVPFASAKVKKEMQGVNPNFTVLTTAYETDPFSDGLFDMSFLPENTKKEKTGVFSMFSAGMNSVKMKGLEKKLGEAENELSKTRNVIVEKETEIERHQMELKKKEESLRAVEAEREQKEAELNEVKERKEAEILAIRQQSEAELLEEQRRKEEELAALRAKKEAELTALEEAKARELLEIKKRKEAELKRLEEEKQKELLSMEEKKKEELLSLEKQKEEELHVLEQEKEEELKRLEEQKALEMKRLEEEKAKELDLLEEQKNREILLKEREISAKENELSALKERSETEINALKQQAKDLKETADKAKEELNEKKQALLDEQYKATHDELTKCLNRLAWKRMTQELIPPYTVICFDVNYLKKFNDNLGHAEGDKLLLTVTEELNKHFEDVFRMGGDEFNVITNKEKEEIDSILISIDEDLKAITESRDPEYPYMVAYGVSDNTEGDLKTMLSLADDRMYQNKRDKKGITAEEMKAESERREMEDIVNDLKRQIEEQERIKKEAEEQAEKHKAAIEKQLFQHKKRLEEEAMNEQKLLEEEAENRRAELTRQMEEKQKELDEEIRRKEEEVALKKQRKEEEIRRSEEEFKKHEEELNRRIKEQEEEIRRQEEVYEAENQKLQERIKAKEEALLQKEAEILGKEAQIKAREEEIREEEEKVEERVKLVKASIIDENDPTCIPGTAHETDDVKETERRKYLSTMWYLKEELSCMYQDKLKQVTLYIYPTEFLKPPYFVQNIVVCDDGLHLFAEFGTGVEIEVDGLTYHIGAHFVKGNTENPFASMITVSNQSGTDIDIAERKTSLHKGLFTPDIFGKTWLDKQCFPIRQNINGLCDTVILKESDETDSGYDVELSNGVLKDGEDTYHAVLSEQTYEIVKMS